MSWRSPSVVEELVPEADDEPAEPAEPVEPAVELAADVDVDAPVELSGTSRPPERPVVAAGCL